MHRSIKILTAAAVAAASLGGWAGIARALPDPDHVGSFSFTNDEYIDVCGVNVHLVEHVLFSYSNMQTHGPSAGVWYANIRIQTDATLTNEANGRFMTEHAWFIPDKVLTAPIVHDNVHDVTVLGVRNDKVWDMDGNLIYHEAGSYQTEFLFDDGGDNAPGGGTVLTEPTITRLSGLHPSEAEACAAFVSALGG